MESTLLQPKLGTKNENSKKIKQKVDGDGGLYVINVSSPVNR